MRNPHTNGRAEARFRSSGSPCSAAVIPLFSPCSVQKASLLLSCYFARATLQEVFVKYCKIIASSPLTGRNPYPPLCFSLFGDEAVRRVADEGNALRA